MPELDTECATCEELHDPGVPQPVIYMCPQSQRPCGHHCNHSWTHDSCCWCGRTFGEDE